MKSYEFIFCQIILNLQTYDLSKHTKTR